MEDANAQRIKAPGRIADPYLESPYRRGGVWQLDVITNLGLESGQVGLFNIKSGT